MSPDVNPLSEEILLAVKLNKSTEPLVDALAHIQIDLLRNQLTNDTCKKAFWINVYNAYFLILRKEKGLQKPDIYRNKVICVAGKHLSLDQIEHGILRRFRHKYSLGYLLNPFTPNWLKSLAVAVIDYRIHFALNCGAKSCPPIAFYTPEKLEDQLNLATQSFLEGETIIDQNKSEVRITSLFKWYHNDFGGNAGIRGILKETLNQDFEKYALIYQEYDWSEDLDNFTSDNS